jgi:hypothetical protein
VQATIKRINTWLIDRGYVTWFDLTNMKVRHQHQHQHQQQQQQQQQQQ